MKEELLERLSQKQNNYCRMVSYIVQMPCHLETIINALNGRFEDVVSEPFTPTAGILVYIPSLDPDTLFIGCENDEGENEWLHLKDGRIISDTLMRSEFKPNELWCVFKY